jgi:hypothetical protein
LIFHKYVHPTTVSESESELFFGFGSIQNIRIISDSDPQNWFPQIAAPDQIWNFSGDKITVQGPLFLSLIRPGFKKKQQIRTTNNREVRKPTDPAEFVGSGLWNTVPERAVLVLSCGPCRGLRSEGEGGGSREGLLLLSWPHGGGKGGWGLVDTGSCRNGRCRLEIGEVPKIIVVIISLLFGQLGTKNYN